MRVTIAIGDQAQTVFNRSGELAAEKAMEWLWQGVLLRIQSSTEKSLIRMKE